MRHLASLALLIGWIAGAVIAKGFWPTLAAVFFPFWSWYLVVEKIMQHLAII